MEGRLLPPVHGAWGSEGSIETTLQPRDKRPSLFEPSLTLVLLATGPKQWLFLPVSTNYSLPGTWEMFMGFGECLRLVGGKIGFKTQGKTAESKLINV